MVYSWRDRYSHLFQVMVPVSEVFSGSCPHPKGASMIDLIMVRGIFILVLAISAYALHPLDSSRWMAAEVGLIFGLCIIFWERRRERVSFNRMIGAAWGSVLKKKTPSPK